MGEQKKLFIIYEDDIENACIAVYKTLPFRLQAHADHTATILLGTDSTDKIANLSFDEILKFGELICGEWSKDHMYVAIKDSQQILFVIKDVTLVEKRGAFRDERIDTQKEREMKVEILKLCGDDHLQGRFADHPMCKNIVDGYPNVELKNKMEKNNG